MTGKVSSYSAQAVVNVYHGEELIEVVTRDKARELKASGAYFFINHGKDLRNVAEFGPQQTLLEKVLGWDIVPQMRNSALNRGRCGQGIANYEIPYVFEGHIKPMRVAIINAGDPLHA